MISVVVHTTGVNWDGVLANVAAISVILATTGVMVVRSLRRSIRDEIHAVIAKDVTPILTQIHDQLAQHDTRLTKLEGIEEGKRQAIAAAGVTTSG